MGGLCPKFLGPHLFKVLFFSLSLWKGGIFFLLIFGENVFGSSFRYAGVNKCNHLSLSVTNKICHIPRC